MVKNSIDDEEFMEGMDEVNTEELSSDIELDYDEEEKLLLDEEIGVEGEEEEEIPSVLLDNVVKPKTEDDWRKLLLEATPEGVPEYKITERYKEGDLLVHPKFGFGVVSKVKTPKKMEVVFENDKKLMAMNIVPPRD